MSAKAFVCCSSRHSPSKISAPVSMTMGWARRSSGLGLDPHALLPASSPTRRIPVAAQPTAIEIHYSDYRAVDGVEIPFHIERSVNGALQLDIVLTSAQAA